MTSSAATAIPSSRAIAAAVIGWSPVISRMPISRSASAASRAGAWARGVSESPRKPASDSSPLARSAMASSSSATSRACCGVSRRRATAITRSPSAASCRTVCSMSGSRPWHAAKTTSGAPLTLSSSSNTDAENDLPDRNGRWASASAVGLESSTDFAASMMARSVACTCGPPLASGAARAAQRRTSSRE